MAENNFYGIHAFSRILLVKILLTNMPQLEGGSTNTFTEDISLELININYRPASNLQFISKVAEKAAQSSFLPHLEDHNLLPSYQSANRKHYSTETALFKLQNGLLIAADNHKLSLFASIDLSAAFDTVVHSILMKVLESRFGVTGTALKWLNSYVKSRNQRVEIDDVLSTKSELSFGVPQGLVLTPSCTQCMSVPYQM